MNDLDFDRRPARRQEIVAAAHAIATEAGWQAVSVRRVAARVGCSAAALYQYLPDKDSILRSIADDGEERLAADLRTAVAEPGRSRRLRAAARAYLTFALDNPELYRVMHGLDGVPRLGRALMDGPVGAILRTTAAALADKHHLTEPAEDVAERWLALLHGHAAVALAGRVDDRDRTINLLATTVDDALRGMARRP